MEPQPHGYIPGKGFSDGWDDRMSGRASRFAQSGLDSNNPYWSEYNHGYTEANIRVIEDARNKQMNESRSFLAESPVLDFKKRMDRMGDG